MIPILEWAKLARWRHMSFCKWLLSKSLGYAVNTAIRMSFVLSQLLRSPKTAAHFSQTSVKVVATLSLLAVSMLPFQNCSSGFQTANLSSLDSSSPASGGATVGLTTLSALGNDCFFNGQIVAQGTSTTTWLNSTGSSSSPCVSETRSCQSGILSGSYLYASCSTGGQAACLFNGQTIPSGSTITAYQATSSGQSCQSETRTCTSGVLSGSLAYASCQAGQPQACLFGGLTVPSGQSVPAFLNANAAAGSACTVQVRTCTNGNLSGYYNSSTCEPSTTPAACSFGGLTIPSGGSTIAFQNSTVAAGATCTQENRTCTNGQLSGSFNYSGCNVSAAASCLFNGQTVASGQSVPAYATSTVAGGQTCSFETRICTNGTLSGSNTFANCTPQAPASCQFNGTTLASGQSTTAYATGQVPFGQTCTPQTITCNNGTLSGTATYGSCNPAAAAPCLFGGQTYADQQTVPAFTAASVAYGQTCSTVAETLTCKNGTLMGSAAGSTPVASCSPQAGQSCTYNGQTVASGQFVQTYTQPGVVYGQNCSTVEQNATCNNGTMSGAAAYNSCAPQSMASDPTLPSSASAAQVAALGTLELYSQNIAIAFTQLVASQPNLSTWETLRLRLFLLALNTTTTLSELDRMNWASPGSAVALETSNNAVLLMPIGQAASQMQSLQSQFTTTYLNISDVTWAQSAETLNNQIRALLYAGTATTVDPTITSQVQTLLAQAAALNAKPATSSAPSTTALVSAIAAQETQIAQIMTAITAATSSMSGFPLSFTTPGATGNNRLNFNSAQLALATAFSNVQNEFSATEAFADQQKSQNYPIVPQYLPYPAWPSYYTPLSQDGITYNNPSYGPCTYYNFVGGLDFSNEVKSVTTTVNQLVATWAASANFTVYNIGNSDFTSINPLSLIIDDVTLQANLNTILTTMAKATASLTQLNVSMGSNLFTLKTNASTIMGEISLLTSLLPTTQMQAVVNSPPDSFQALLAQALLDVAYLNTTYPYGDADRTTYIYFNYDFVSTRNTIWLYLQAHPLTTAQEQALLPMVQTLRTDLNVATAYWKQSTADGTGTQKLAAVNTDLTAIANYLGTSTVYVWNTNGLLVPGVYTGGGMATCVGQPAVTAKLIPQL